MKIVKGLRQYYSNDGKYRVDIDESGITIWVKVGKHGDCDDWRWCMDASVLFKTDTYMIPSRVLELEDKMEVII